jgi:hypothetical protein
VADKQSVGQASSSRSVSGLSRRARQREAAQQRRLININCTNNRPTTATPASSDISQPHPSLYLLNATSLKKKTGKKNAIQLLTTDVLRGNFEIVFITESWLSPKQQSSVFNIPGYTMQRRDCIRRVGGGLCTYIRDDLSIIDFQAPVKTSGTVEIQWTHCFSNNRHYFLANCYYPPKPKHTVQEFVGQLAATIEHITNKFDEPHFIIAGDFNRLDTNFLATEFGFQCISNKITHGKRILDKIFVSWPSTYTVRVVSSLLKTKHKAVTARDDGEEPDDSSCSRKTVYVYDQRQHNIDKLRHAIGTYDWIKLKDSSDLIDM